MKTRFAPSPTGYMHLGNLRTALFSALFAKSQNGSFLLRIEDTDTERSETKYTKDIFLDLRWLELDWDEGPEKDLGNGPYFQSQRAKIYKKYYKQLEETDLVYPCFCSAEQLKLARKLQLSSGKPPRYAGTCAQLSKQEAQKRINAGEPYTLRFRVPKNTTIEFNDFVKGLHKFKTNDIGDFIVRRTNGTTPFMYCNSIDDSMMEVTHVIRGEDHVANTANQIMILEALGLPVPQYGHISLILGYDGAPLSKRHGSSSIQDMRNDGFLPGAIVNYLARLGHYYKDNSYMSIMELAEQFKAEHLSKSPAKFDKSQLLHWQKLAITKLNEKELWQWLGEGVHTLIPKKAKELFIKTIAANIVFPDDAEFWAEVFFSGLHELDAEKTKTIQDAGTKFYETALSALAKHNNDYQKVTNTLKEELGIKGKALFMPLRIAITGEAHGPELANIFELLGTDELKKRLKYAGTLSH